MNPHDDIRDEEQIASLLSATQADAAPPDARVLAHLRVQSTEAFTVAEGAVRARSRKRAAIMKRARWLTAAAAVIGLSFALYFWLAPEASGGLTFGQVLENVEKADTVHLRIENKLATSDGKVGYRAEFWHVSEPKRWRIDYDKHYRIGDGTRFWIIVENENLAKRGDRYQGLSDSMVYLMAGLGLVAEPEMVLAAHPVKRMPRGSTDVLVYHIKTKHMKGIMRVEATLDAKTHRLQSLTSRYEVDGTTELVGELTVIAYDQPIAADKFIIADTLTEDGRIGKVNDVQGIVTVKPVLHERWTPVRERLVLKPGDWLRTDARGANAAALRLVKNTGVILGPKTLVELIGPKQIRLIEGAIEITAAGAAIELLGPGPEKISVRGKQLYRVEKQQLVQVAKEPAWLLGFKGSTANESLGSLVATVDGRNVPLTVGYHKVNVDIRDQIARTVIEESFVNHTDAVLEGVFHFPLPADASISGFGMWIGEQYVEADVVEKQRAREIYETILREQRDPGLLEWSGGNLFKARVFPIPAHAEKRIKIPYTQVLPLKGSRYRYSYALQSELLQQHPLRDLSIDVKVHSVAPLKSVTSPTHPTRDERTTHSAHVEFTAQEYRPTRDFEVVVEVEDRQADVVLIPHRRGDDGYFLLQLSPPGAGGAWDRPILPNGEPLQLLILADTSASIDAGQRATQATFVGSLLASLSSKDTFNLATCDVACDWAFTQPTAADAKHIETARAFLAKRSSLGWTDLDAAFGDVIKRCGPKTHVIYVGDGIPTTGDADPVAFAQRLRRNAEREGASFHAISLGSSYESGVLKAIASLGGGSMRRITGEQGPQTVARELLGEIAQPALRDIKVEFQGFKAARVYPETLANVPAGSQQILLGRYLPEGVDQAGEIIVTGTQGGKPVRFSTRASFKDAEQGNSFIPRLWARMHLDSLLEQGSSDAIKDEIIALSEEFQIITPYTSLLVLETDADRERFKVTRRFQMRDGERFFAEGRDNAVLDLAQKQMKKAGDWRTALRRSVLSELARMGRDRTGTLMLGAGMSHLGEIPYDDVAGGAGALPLGDRQLGDLGLQFDETEGLLQRPGDPDLDEVMHEYRGATEKREDEARRAGDSFGFDEPHREPIALNGVLSRQELEDVGGYSPSDGDWYFRRGNSRYAYGQWLNTLFPPLAGAPRQAKEPKSTWLAAARTLAKSLLRTEQLAKLTGGIEIVRQSDLFNPRWGDLPARSRQLELVATKAWLTRSASDGGQTVVSWCDAKEIGVFSQAFQLGRVRSSTPLDLQPPLELSDHSLVSLEQIFANYTPTLEPQGPDRTLLVLKRARTPLYDTRILIDTARHVIVSIEDRHKGKAISTTRFDDFIEAAGSWWARRIETTDETGKRTSLVTQTIRTMPLADLEQRMKTELAGRALQVQFLRLPLPSVASAKKAAGGGQGGLRRSLRAALALPAQPAMAARARSPGASG